MIFSRSTFYILADWALDSFFKGIVINFHAPKFDFHIGMEIRKITDDYTRNYKIYTEGIIENIDSYGELHIRFQYIESKSMPGQIYRTNSIYYFNMSELERLSDGIYRVRI